MYRFPCHLPTIVWLLGLGLAAGSIGCAQKTPPSPTTAHAPEHEARPDSYAAAVAQIREHGATIARAYSAGTPDEAHEALHEVGHLLGLLPELAGDTGMQGEDRQAVQDASRQLMEAYGKLDQLMHGAAADKSAQAADTFAGVADDITAATKTLEAKIPVSREGTPPASNIHPGEEADAGAEEGSQVAQSSRLR